MDQIAVDPMLFGALVALVTIAAAALGYFLGRRQPREEDLARIAELEGRLERAQASAETTRDDIDEHFETSAALFGKLAQDYRDLFEHWADSATRLGVSETRAGAIIDQARSRLLEDDRTVEVAADAEAEPGDTGPRPETRHPPTTPPRTRSTRRRQRTTMRPRWTRQRMAPERRPRRTIRRPRTTKHRSAAPRRPDARQPFPRALIDLKATPPAPA